MRGITVAILRDDNVWCPFGHPFHIPEPDTVLCFHLCPSLLAYHVSVQLACVSLQTLALGHISLEDLGHPESSMPNPFLHISRNTAPCVGPGSPRTPSPTLYSYSSGSRPTYPCLSPAIRGCAHPVFLAAVPLPQDRVSCSPCWLPTLYVAEACLGFYLPSTSQMLELERRTTIPSNTCFSRMLSLCGQPCWPMPFSKCLAYHTSPPLFINSAMAKHPRTLTCLPVPYHIH